MRSSGLMRRGGEVVDVVGEAAGEEAGSRAILIRKTSSSSRRWVRKRSRKSNCRRSVVGPEWGTRTLKTSALCGGPIMASVEGEVSKVAVEVRVMCLRAPNEIALRPVLNLVRLSRGKMHGVDHNKDMKWTGSSVGIPAV